MTNDFWGFQSNLLVKMLGHKLDELKLQLECQTTGPHLVRSLKSKGTSAKIILSFSLKNIICKNICPQKILGPYNNNKKHKKYLINL